MNSKIKTEPQHKEVNFSEDIISNITVKELIEKWLDKISQMSKDCLYEYYREDWCKLSITGVKMNFCQAMINIGGIVLVLKDMFSKDVKEIEDMFVAVYGKDSDEVYTWRKFFSLYDNQFHWKEEEMFDRCSGDERLRTILTNSRKEEKAL